MARASKGRSARPTHDTSGSHALLIARDPAIPGVMEHVPVAAHRGALAGTKLDAVPIILLVIFFQKCFISSAASRAVKG